MSCNFLWKVQISHGWNSPANPLIALHSFTLISTPQFHLGELLITLLISINCSIPGVSKKEKKKYVLRSSRISLKSGALIVRYSQKEGHISFVSYCSDNLSIYNFGTTGLIQVRFSAKCNSPNENFNEIENWKCHMFDFWLIPLDCITYGVADYW